MAETGSVHPVDILIGRTVISRATANRLGQVQDLIIDPVAGGLAGIAVKMADDGLRYVELIEIYSIGPDAIMVNNDRSAIPPQNSTLKVSPLAMNKLVGAEVITEGGKILGQVANIFIYLAEEPLLMYEVRSSLLDKLLGNALFFAASEGRAFSGDDTRLVVADDTAEKAHNSLDALANHLFGPPQQNDPVVIVRSRSH